MEVVIARRALLLLSVVLAVLEIADGFRLSIPWAAWMYAVLLLGGSLWLWRTGSTAAVVTLGVLQLFELLMLLLVFRTAEEGPALSLWWLLVLVSAGGTLAAGLALLAQRRPAPRAP